MASPQRPSVTLHFAQSLDGRIATRSGEARWISGPEATRFSHELRAASDAVIVGSGTALTDDPLLTVRHVRGASPRRIVLDARGRVPATAKVVADASAPTVLVTCPGRAPRARDLPAHVSRVELPAAEGGDGVDLAALLDHLAAAGVARVLVEGGHRVLTSFLRTGLADRLVITLAPMVLGAGIEAVGDLGTERLAQARRFVTRRVWQLGGDVLLELERAHPAGDRVGGTPPGLGV